MKIEQTVLPNEPYINDAPEIPVDQNSKVPVETFAQLATLSPVEYEQVRKEKAEQLDVRVPILDKEVSKLRETEDVDQGQSIIFNEPEPWHESVDGEELLNDIVSILKRFLFLPDKAAEAIALWIVFTYVFDQMRICPILLLTSPEKRCGKTLLMSLLLKLCHRAIPSSNISPAALFRATEQWHPTLIIDEADTYLKNNDELNGIINSGHTRDLAYVIRTVPVGDGHEPRRFSTWNPKAVASIGKLKDTLVDRSIEIPMRRKAQGEQVERFKNFDGTEIQSRCLRFVKDNKELLRSSEPDIPSSLHDRAADNWEPLLAIADVTGEKWSKLAREAATALTQVDDDSIKVQLLADIKNLFEEKHKEKLHTDALLTSLNSMDERPWSEWRHGKALSARNLSQLLKGFGIGSRTVRINDRVRKGYERKDFKDAFVRYIPEEKVTTLQTNADAPISNSEKVTDSSIVTDDNVQKPLADKDCNLVTDKSTVEWT